MTRKEDFINRSRDAANDFKKPRTEEDKINMIDDDHKPIWQLVAFCDSQHYGFENIMASIFYASKTKAYSFNYRFAYGDGRKNRYNFRSKAGKLWIPAKEFNLEKAKESMRAVMIELERVNGNKLEIRETEFTGKESQDEIMAIFQRSGLVNMAKVDPKTKEVEVVEYSDLEL